MKMHHWLLSVLIASVLALTGCSKSGSGGGTASVDAAPVEKSFASAEPVIKAAADKAVAAIKGADYSSAVTELQKLASNVKLTDDQKKAARPVAGEDRARRPGDTRDARDQGVAPRADGSAPDQKIALTMSPIEFDSAPKCTPV